MTYTKQINSLGTESIVRLNEDGTETWIPTDPANSDYQAYLNKDKPQVEHLTESVTKAK